MLNKKAIFDVLNAAPLCGGTLIRQAGLAVEYCAMGAIAKSVGATDEQLHSFDGGGNDIWKHFGPQITAKFGIETLAQFQSLMRANDAEPFITRRNKAVINQVEALSPEQINEIIAEEAGGVCDENAPSSSEQSYHYGSDD